MLRRIAIAAAFLLAAVPRPNAMNFIWRDRLTVRASGPIEKGDATKFAALPRFDTLELDSPGGFVGEALAMAANMDARGGIRTVVKPGASCASACAMALFVSGETRVVYMGGRLGIHSCAMLDGTRAPECNTDISAAVCLWRDTSWAAKVEPLLRPKAPTRIRGTIKFRTAASNHGATPEP